MGVRLYLVRHGAADGDDPDAGLTPAGEQQVRALARRLRDVPLDAIRHSPLPRAARTAALLAEDRAGVVPQPSARLTDRTPVPSPARAADYPTRYAPWLAQAPDAERDEDGAALSAAVAHFGSAPPAGTDRHELLVTHAFVVGWFVRAALDAPTWRWLTLLPANASLTVIDHPDDRPAAVLSFNDTGHLG